MGRDMVSIKGTRNGLVIVFDPNREFDEIKNTLLSKMESARGFFKGARFSLSRGHLEFPDNQKSELENICRQYGLVPNIDKKAALRTDLMGSPQKRDQTCTRLGLGDNALLVRRSLRSGQRIAHAKHIVILGDIHHGAEVVSGGNVMVLGRCRGVVHAGAGGDRSAKVIAQLLEPTVLIIADRRHTPEINGSIPAECRVARLSGREIVFEKYQTGR